MFLFRHIFLTIFIFALTEVVVLSQVSDLIGWGWTILSVVATAMIGSALLKQQGLDTWMRINERLQQGEVPGSELIEGVMLLIGGALLITPGFITDGIGFLFLLPTTRKAFARWLIAKGVMETMVQSSGANGGISGGAANGNAWVYQHSVQSSTFSSGQGSARRQPGSGVPGVDDSAVTGDIIEGEVIHKEEG